MNHGILGVTWKRRLIHYCVPCLSVLSVVEFSQYQKIEKSWTSTAKSYCTKVSS